MEDSNSAKGRDSFDVNTGNTLVHFFNRNVTPYPTEAGSVKFDLVPVAKQKDLMINHARMYAQKEYDRIMELVSVLEKQARAIKRRLEITDSVHAAVYQFQPVMWNVFPKEDTTIDFSAKSGIWFIEICLFSKVINFEIFYGKMFDQP